MTITILSMILISGTFAVGGAMIGGYVVALWLLGKIHKERAERLFPGYQNK